MMEENGVNTDHSKDVLDTSKLRRSLIVTLIFGLGYTGLVVLSTLYIWVNIVFLFLFLVIIFVSYTGYKKERTGSWAVEQDNRGCVVTHTLHLMHTVSVLR